MKTLLIYKSVSGLTRRYAEYIARQTGCTLLPLRQATPAAVQGYDAIVFGTRLHAGHLVAWPRARRLLAASGAPRCAVFATGAMPAAATAELEKVWRDNLSAQEQATLPHFYLPAGLCYEQMSRTDRLMMRMAASFLEKQYGADSRNQRSAASRGDSQANGRDGAPAEGQGGSSAIGHADDAADGQGAPSAAAPAAIDLRHSFSLYDEAYARPLIRFLRGETGV